MKIHSFTSVNRRENNEDSCLSFSLNVFNKKNQPLHVLILADGMGGLDYGEMVSNAAVHQFAKAFVEEVLKKAIVPKPTINELKEFRYDFKSIILQTLEIVNKQVLRFLETNKIKRGGSTIVVAIVAENTFYYGYLGDSRLYHWKNSSAELTCVTQDHNVPGILLFQGLITSEVARFHAQRNQLVYFVGADKLPSPDKFPVIGQGDLGEGDQLLLCSDGFSNRLDSTLEQHFRNKLKESPERPVETWLHDLAQEATNAGESDNQTVLLYEHSFDARSLTEYTQVHIDYTDIDENFDEDEIPAAIDKDLIVAENNDAKEEKHHFGADLPKNDEAINYEENSLGNSGSLGGEIDTSAMDQVVLAQEHVEQPTVNDFEELETASIVSQGKKKRRCIFSLIFK